MHRIFSIMPSRLAPPKTKGLRMLLWYAIAAAAVGLDYVTGPLIQFPVAFLLPVLLIAWFERPADAYVAALILPLCRLVLATAAWDEPVSLAVEMANGGIRIAVLAALAHLAAGAAATHREMQHEVELLEQILPICAWCKKIRNEDGSWQSLERYLHASGRSAISHGICADCEREHTPADG